MKDEKIRREFGWSIRQDGVSLRVSCRVVYLNFNLRLSACKFRRCPFVGLTCNKCCYCV